VEGEGFISRIGTYFSSGYESEPIGIGSEINFIKLKTHCAGQVKEVNQRETETNCEKGER
jgi:hypothetical protein